MTEKIKNIALVFGSKVVIFLVSFVRGFIVPGVLGPSMYGIIELLRLLQTMLGFSDLGFREAYLRLVIADNDKKNPDVAIKDLQNTVFSFLLISSLLGTIITILIPIFINQDTPEMARLMWFCYTATAITHFFTLSGTIFYQTQYVNKNFSLISKLTAFQSILSFVLIISTVFFWNIYGVFLAETVSVIVIQSIYFYKTKIQLQFSIKYKEFTRIFKFAYPFFLSNLGFYFARLSDRTIITMFLSIKDLGIYGFALNLSTQLRLVSVAFNEVITPYFLEKIASEKNLFRIKENIKEYTHFVVALTLLIIVPLFFLIDFIVLILPKFSDAINVLKILLINTYIITIPLYQILILGSANIKKQKIVSLNLIIGGLINWGLSIALVKSGYGIFGVAIGTTISNFIIVTLHFGFSHKYYLKRKELWYYIKMIVPLILLIILAFLFANKQGSLGFFRIRYFIAIVFSELFILILFRKETITIFKVLTTIILRKKNN